MANKILKSFLDQANIDSGHINQSEIYEKTVEELERRADSVAQAKVWAERSSAGMDGHDLSKHIDIPTQNPDISQETKPHPQLADYDHSLEEKRWKGTGGSDPIEMEDI